MVLVVPGLLTDRPTYAKFIPVLAKARSRRARSTRGCPKAAGVVSIPEAAHSRMSAQS